MEASNFLLPKVAILLQRGRETALGPTLIAAWGMVPYATSPAELELQVRDGARLVICDEASWAQLLEAQRALLAELSHDEGLRVLVLTEQGGAPAELPPPVHRALPRSTSAPDLVSAIHELLADRGRGAALPPPPPASAPRKVVVVDDSELLNRITSTVLRRAGYTVTCLTNPFELYRQLKMDPPDLVLIDYNIPALRGSSLIQIVRQSGVVVPLVLYSNFSESFLAETAQGCGASGYIRKGVTPEVLLAKLEAFFRPAAP